MSDPIGLGPAIRTLFGDLGFWGGKDISAACAFWSGSDEVKAAGLWRKPELTEVCQTLFDEKVGLAVCFLYSVSEAHCEHTHHCLVCLG